MHLAGRNEYDIASVEASTNSFAPENTVPTIDGPQRQGRMRVGGIACPAVAGTTGFDKRQDRGTPETMGAKGMPFS